MDNDPSRDYSTEDMKSLRGAIVESLEKSTDEKRSEELSSLREEVDNIIEWDRGLEQLKREIIHIDNKSEYKLNKKKIKSSDGK